MNAADSSEPRNSQSEPALPAIAPSQTGWGVIPQLLLTCSIPLLYLLFIGDRRTSHELERLAWLLIAIAALTDRLGPLRPRLRLTALIVAVSLPAATIPAILSERFAEAAGFFLRYFNWLIYLFAVWLASPILLARMPAGAKPDSNAMRRTSANSCFKCIVVGLLLYLWFCLLSAFGAADLKSAMELWGAEIGAYAALFLIGIRLFAVRQPFEGWMLKIIVIITGLVLGAMIAVLVLRLIGPEAEAALIEREFIRIEEADPSAPWRLQFPFEHHNRVGFFSACAIFLLLAGGVGRRWAGAAALGTAAAAIALLYSVTRGALVAALAGIVALFAGKILSRAKLRWLALLALLPLTFFLLPQSHQRQISQVFKPSSYRPGAESTIGARLVIWQKSAQLVAMRPLIGHGYGYKSFEIAFEKHFPESNAAIKGISHAHNQWLELAAEIGIPGTLVFLVFTLLRLGFLAGAWRLALRAGQPAANLLLIWLALEIVILVYGLSNYPLRRNLGFFTYAIWSAGCVFALRERASSEGIELPRSQAAQSQASGAASTESDKLGRAITQP